MKNKILFVAILAAFAASGCQKQADTTAAPAAAPGPSGTVAPAPAAPAPSSMGSSESLAPAQSQYAATADYSDEEYPPDDVGVNVASYPNLVPVPGYPVYYAPGMNSNYFFYDGAYWVYSRDNWYASTWYNGPWNRVGPDAVPLFILRVPVRYYREPPAYFRGWQGDAPPQWGVHWGHDWEKHRSGWDQWNHKDVPKPAPLPVYQRQYSGNKYPTPQLRVELLKQNYHYEPKDAAAQHIARAQAVAQHGGPPAIEQKPGMAPQAHPQTETRPEPPQAHAPQKEALPAHAPPAAAPEKHPEAKPAPHEPQAKPPENHEPARVAPKESPHEAPKPAAPHEPPAPKTSPERPGQAKEAPKREEEKKKEEERK